MTAGNPDKFGDHFKEPEGLTETGNAFCAYSIIAILEIVKSVPGGRDGRFLFIVTARSRKNNMELKFITLFTTLKQQ